MGNVSMSLSIAGPALAGARPTRVAAGRGSTKHCSAPTISPRLHLAGVALFRGRCPPLRDLRSWAKRKDDDGSEFDLPPLPGRERQAWEEFSRVQAGEEAVGAQHGEGFINFSFSGALHLDVEDLNEKLQVSGADRIRISHKPDEAFGMVFSWDGVLADSKAMQKRAWENLAAESGHRMPEIERPAIYNLMPEKAIMELLHWTGDMLEARRLAHRVALLYAEEFEAHSEPLEGTREWLSTLHSVGVPCTICTPMGREMVNDALQRMDLAHFFQASVTAEDGMDSIAQRFLSASIKMHRPPNKCVVFDSTPNGITAAHNCSMKAVAVVGAHGAWELKQADLATTRLSELSVINVRRLFAVQGIEHMDLAQQFVGKPPPTLPIANATMDHPEEPGEGGEGSPYGG